MAYKDLKKLSKGTGLEAHHLVEKRFASKLGIKEKDILSIAIDKDAHAKITELYRNTYLTIKQKALELRRVMPLHNKYGMQLKRYILNWV